MSGRSPQGSDDPGWDLEDQPEKPFISQRLMNVVSVLLVLSLVFGSMTAAVVWANQSQDVAILIGLAVAVTLLVGWFALNAGSRRRR